MANPAPASIFEVTARRHERRPPDRASEARLVFETGAFSEGSIEGIAAILSSGPYRWDAHEVRRLRRRDQPRRHRLVPRPGAPQATFALEQLLDELAGRLGLDPIELRRRNRSPPRATRWPTASRGAGSASDECLDAARRRTRLGGSRRRCPAGEGVGIARRVWPGGRQPAAAICRLEPDGTVTVVDGVVDMSGTTDGLRGDRRRGSRPVGGRRVVISADTASAPRSPLSGGSVITYSIGRALVRGDGRAPRQDPGLCRAELEIDAGDLEIVDGVVQPAGRPTADGRWPSSAEELDGFGATFEPLEGHGGAVRPTSPR